jgi:hypothetical protein
VLRHRILLPLAVGSLLAAPLAACADDDTDDAGTTTTEQTTTTEPMEVDEAVLERVTEAAQATIDEGTAAFTIEARQETGDDSDTGVGSGRDGTTTTRSDDDGTTTTRGDGDDRTTTTRADDTTGGGGAEDDQRESPVQVEGEIDFEADQRRLTFVGPDGELDMILDGSTAYIELPATEDDDWARIDLDELLDTQVGVGGPAALPFQDPADNLRVLQGNVIATSEEGTEEVDGEDTDRFRLVIDLEASVSDAPEDVQEALEETLARTGVQELEMHVWIDQDDLIRRVEYTLDLDEVRIDEEDTTGSGDADGGAVQADPEGRLVVVFEYFDFGTDVQIELPDEENIVDIDEQAIRDSLGLDDDGSNGGRTDDTTTTTTGGTGTGNGRDTTTTTTTRSGN